MNPMTEVMRFRKIQAQLVSESDSRVKIDTTISMLASGARPRVTRDIARAVLLQSPCHWDGRWFAVHGKSVGAGVWELRSEDTP